MDSGKDHRETILVVEDDAGVAELQRIHLERAGLTVLVAGTSHDALETLRRHQVDLILLDYRLSEKSDGLDAYLEWKTLGFDIPVILVTGFSDEAVAIQALRSGVRDFLSKSTEYLDFLPQSVERVLKQVRTDRRLAESEARLASIIDTANEAIFIGDEGLRITLFNRAAEVMFRCTASQAIGQPVSRLIPPLNVPGSETRIDDVGLRPEPPISSGFEGTRGLRWDGTEFPVELSVSRTEVGGRGFHTIIVRDITERKEAEDATRRRFELQRQLAMIAEAVPGVICSLRKRPEGPASMPFAMSAIEDLCGIPASELAESIAALASNVHPGDIEKLRGSLNEAFKQASFWHCKFRYLHPVKGLRWLEGWSSGQAEPDGSVLWHGFLMDVTDRESAEIARRESERIARSILDSLTSSIALLDATGVILEVNRSWRLFAESNGASTNVCEGANYLEACESATDEVGDHARAFAAGIRDVLDGRRASFELEYPCHSGSERRWFLGRVSPLLEGGPRGVIVSHHNITDRELAEERLRNRERMLSQSQKMAHVGSWEFDLGDHAEASQSPLRFSEEWFRIFGYEPGQIHWNKTELYQAFHPDDRERIMAGMARMRSEGTPFELEHRIVRPDGTERTVHVWSEVLRNSDGHPQRVVGTCQDITERKAAELALRASEERLALATEAAGLGTWDFDMTSERVTWSTRQKELFGFRPDEFDGTSQSVYGRVHPDDQGELVQVYTNALETRQPYHHEYRIVLPDGTIRWVAGLGRFSYNEAGIAKRVSGVSQDVTKRKMAEVALHNYAMRLENLRSIDQAILSARSPEGLAEEALRQLEPIVPTWMGAVIVFDFDRSEIKALSGTGQLSALVPVGKWFKADIESHPDREILRAGEVSYIADVMGLDAKDRPLLEEFRAAGLRSYIFVPLIDRGRLFGMLSLGSDHPSAFTPEHITIAREVSDHLAIALSQAVLLEENQVSKKRLESLTRRLMKAEEEERRRIARELHDEIGQALTAVKINLQQLDLGREEFKSRLTECTGLVEQLLGQVRGMALDLRPSLLDDLGLADALRWYVRRHAERSGLIGQFIAEPDQIDTDPEIATACFRVAQEALTNVARHAGASRFSVELLDHAAGLQLIVRDDGNGFNPDSVREDAALGKSSGLSGIRERVELLGGKVAVVSAPGLGTEIQVDFPKPAGPAITWSDGPGERKES